MLHVAIFEKGCFFELYTHEPFKFQEIISL